MIPILHRLSFYETTSRDPAAEISLPAPGLWLCSFPPDAAQPTGTKVLEMIHQDAAGPLPPAEREMIDAHIRPCAYHCAKDGIEIHWGAGRALIRTATGLSAQVLPAIAEAAYVEARIGDLEALAESAWAPAHRHKRLAGQVERADKPELAELVAWTEKTLGAQLDLSRWSEVFREPTREIPGKAREIGAYMRRVARHEERLEALEERIDTLAGVYEIASQRAGEFRHAQEGTFLEIAIIALLAVEVVLLFFNVF